MSRLMFGSGKFVPPVSGYSLSPVKGVQEATGLENPGLVSSGSENWIRLTKADMNEQNSYKQEDPESPVNIPPPPENPDNRPLFIQYAEEYFGRYWFVSVALILFLLLRKK